MNKLITLPLIVVLLSSCNGSNSRVKVVKDCTVYESFSYFANVDIYFFDNKDIPYISISEPFSIFWELWDYKEIDATSALISNKIGYSFTLNLSTTEVTYNNFDLLLQNSTNDENEIYDDLNYSLVPNKRIAEESEFVKGKSYSLKLSDFGFTFEKFNDKYYAPIDVLSSISGMSISYYYENKILTSLPVEYEGLKEKLSFNHSFSNSYYEHCFNIYMLEQEIHSGLKGITRKLLSNGGSLTYFKKGVINTLLPYKEKIVNSKSIEEFDKGMMDMINMELNSGGHDVCGQVSFNSKQQYLYPTEFDVVDYTEIDVKKEREKSQDAKDFKNCVYAYDSDNDGKKDIGYVTFDKFLDLTTVNPDGSTDYGMVDILLGENGANAVLNPKSKTYDSSKYNIKDIVIDLSANGGGSVAAENTLSAWLCGGKIQQSYRNPNTGSYNKSSHVYDVNKDGVYDEQDYLPNYVNIYILTSNGSYSAANAMPFKCYCYNKNTNPTNKIKFMGARPGGGTCCTNGPIYLATGFGFYISYHRSEADYKDPIYSSENEIKITEGLELSLSQMTDRTGNNGINKLICSKRK